MIREQTSLYGNFEVSKTIETEGNTTTQQVIVGSMSFNMDTTSNNFSISVNFSDKDTAMSNIDNIKSQFNEFLAVAKEKVNAQCPLFTEDTASTTTTSTTQGGN